MTPIQPRRSAGPVCEAQPEEALVCRQPSPLEVFQADSFSTSTPPELPRSEQIRNHYAQQVLERSRSRILASAFSSPSSASSSDSSNPVAFSLWGALSLLSATGCSNHAPLSEDGGGGPPIGNPDPDRPPQNPNGADGGLGAGINTAFATSACLRPLDLDPSSTAGSAIMTCGVNGLSGGTTGVGTAERIDATSGAVTTMQLPITLGGDTNRPVFTTTSAQGSNGIVYTGFAPRNTATQLQGDSSLFSNSGVYTWNESNPSAATFNTFDRMQIKIAGDILPISLETHETVQSIRPNGPVSTVRVGDHLFVLSENRALNPSDGRLTNAPATVHRYSIASNGALTPAPVASVQPGNMIWGTNTQTNAILLDGMFHPSAIGDVGDGRIAMVVQGSADGTNRSSLVVNTTDFGPGFNQDPAHPDEPVSSTIPLIDANNPDAPDFAVNDSTQVSIVSIGGVPHALLGSSDGSGRIAVVNLDKNPVENRVRFVNVFDDNNDFFSDDGGNIANIVTRPDGAFAYVISDTGKARAVTLGTGTDFGAVGSVYNVTASAPAAGTQLPSLFLSNSILMARPNGYSKAPISSN